LHTPSNVILGEKDRNATLPDGEPSGGTPATVLELRGNSGTDQNPPSLRGHLAGSGAAVQQRRVAAFGEAAMLSAQLTGLDRHAMARNAPRAKQNPHFLLNLMRWLTEVI
jgi:hypothetical protein